MIGINTSHAKAMEITTFENTKAHFIEILSENSYSEVTYGETLGKTKDICFGNIQPRLEMVDGTSMKLNFWHLIA